jgi:type III pantothenate kinase
MLLAIDVGNTHTVVAIFEGPKLVADRRMPSSPHRTSDEYWHIIRTFCAGNDIDPTRISGAGISSVVPELTLLLETMVRAALGTEPLTVHAGLDLGISVRYHDPASLGTDRLCNAVAGFRKYGGPLIVVDFGTATTYDVVSERGEFLGGVIALGLASTAAELHRRTAQLPDIELRFPSSVIARDTVSGMQAGVMFGTLDAVEGTIRRIREELGVPAPVIATGGLSALIAQHTDVITAYEPSLVLDGVRLIYERVRGIQNSEF